MSEIIKGKAWSGEPKIINGIYPVEPDHDIQVYNAALAAAEIKEVS